MYLQIAIIAVLLTAVPFGLHNIDEGYVGVYYRVSLYTHTHTHTHAQSKNRFWPFSKETHLSLFRCLFAFGFFLLHHCRLS